jgi:transposase
VGERGARDAKTKQSVRVATVVGWLTRIKNSKISVRKFFQRFGVPFSREHYFSYKRKYEAGGAAALEDGRANGNHRKLNVDAEGFLAAYVRTRPEVSLGELQRLLTTRLKVAVAKPTLSTCLKRLRISLTPGRLPTVAPTCTYTPFGGLELITALACHLGWPQNTAEILRQTLRRSRAQQGGGWNRRPDLKGRNVRGRFTSRYNRRKDIRENKFAGVEDKRGRKNLASMSIAGASPCILARKSLALLTLPLLTRQGMTRSVDTALGESLDSLCGFNYKNETLRKFFAELKYLGAAKSLLLGQVPYWQKQWKATSQGELQLPLLCYYVDGNTKAYWSGRRVEQNKVTMLGRVMGCLEQVFVHDQFGRPLYFETYSGHAPLGEYVLKLFEKIEENLEAPGGRVQVNRAIVIDGAGNSVRTLRAFAAQKKYHYITSLDDNQWAPRKIRREGRVHRYAHGPATLSECELELEDSAEPGYLIVTRAIKIDWDYGRRTVLITSLV